MSIDRELFFDAIRDTLFGGSFTQGQVDGLNAILNVYETQYPDWDLRWVANCLAQSAHETGFKCAPVPEYQGAQQSYGQVDPETGQRYYGRGLIQTTHRENYCRADTELGLTGDRSCEWNAELQLDPEISAATMFQGMSEGWFRSKDGKPETLTRHFNESTNDVYGARNIVNGDASTVPSWSGGVSIGNLIKGYHEKFLAALESAWTDEAPPVPAPAEGFVRTITIWSASPIDVEIVDGPAPAVPETGRGAKCGRR